MVERAKEFTDSFFNINLIDVPIPAKGVVFEPTVSGAVERDLLDDYERGVVLAADALNIPFQMQVTMVVANISNVTGEERARAIFGFEDGEVESAKNSVDNNPDYKIPNIQFNLLKGNIDLAMIAVFKKYGLKNAKIAQILEVDLETVNAMTQILADYEITNPRNSSEEWSRRFRLQISDDDEKSKGNFLTEKELAERYGVKPQEIHRARRVNRNLGRASTLSREEVREISIKIQKLIMENPYLTDNQIFEMAESMEINGVTPSKVTHVRHELIRTGGVAGKRRNYGEHRSEEAVLTLTETAEKIMERIVDEYLGEGEKMVLSDVGRVYFPNMPLSTVRYIWHKIKDQRVKDGREVPELRFKRTRRAN